MGHQLLLSIWLAHQLDAFFEVDLGLPAGGGTEGRGVGHRVVDVAVEGTLDVRRVDVVGGVVVGVVWISGVGVVRVGRV